jgi:glycosyltransferase involved in cell wall biosynthesis
MDAPAPRQASREILDRPFGVNVAGYLRAETGVGEAVRASTRALEAAEVPHVLNDFFDAWASNIDAPMRGVRAENPFRVNLVHVNADQVSAFVREKQVAYFEGRYNIGFWFWELARFPEEWRSSFDWFDEIWVASAFVQDTISEVAPIPVVKMPLALRPRRAIESQVAREALGLPSNRFVFLYMFDFRSVMERKNPLGLIRAFRRAFADRTDVLLVLKTTNANVAAVGRPVFEAARDAANVRIIDAVVPRDEVDGLIAACDCYVSLHRSEGFGVTIAEAMSFGKPVIATAYAGNMDFTTPENSLLVRYELVTLERDFGPYRRGTTWAEPDLDHAAFLMRNVVTERDAGRALGERARADVSRRLDPLAIGSRMRERLSRMTT